MGVSAVFKRIGSLLFLAIVLTCAPAAAVGKLISAAAGYHEMPFDTPKAGREWWHVRAAG